MGRNNDYAYETLHDDATQTSEDEDETMVDLDPESWQDLNSQHLLNMYMSLVEYCETQGLQFMTNVSFNDFCHFIFNRVI
jgi:hypothetical protein